MQPMKPMVPMKPMAGLDSSWWPKGLSSPSSSGSQNGVRYAFFPDQRRLAVEQDGNLKQYDTGEHRISGVSQAQRQPGRRPALLQPERRCRSGSAQGSALTHAAWPRVFAPPTRLLKLPAFSDS